MNTGFAQPEHGSRPTHLPRGSKANGEEASERGDESVGGAIIKPVRKGLSALVVDLCDGEPPRHGTRGERHAQAIKAAEILGVERTTLTLQDRLIVDAVEPRLQVARLLREHRSRMGST